MSGQLIDDQGRGQAPETLVVHRVLADDDQRQLASICRLASVEHQRADTKLLRPADSFADYFGRSGYVVAALFGAQLLGFCLLRLPHALPEFWTPHLRAWEVDRHRCAGGGQLVVDEAWRGRGIGSGLIATRTELARTLGFAELLATVHPHNARVRAMLARQGFVEVCEQAIYGGSYTRVLVRRQLDAEAVAP